MKALVLSWDPEGETQGALVALEAPSGSQREVVVVVHHHTLVEAWEEGVPSYLDALGDPWDAQRVLSVACPCVGAVACQGVVVPGADWIPGVLEVEAPYLAVHGGASASGAFLGACLQEGREVAQVGGQNPPLVVLVLLELGAWSCQGASQGA